MSNSKKLNDEIKNYSLDDLKKLSDDIRTDLIDTVSETGGHLASNLGMVELTIALHYVFDGNKDKLVFDVGHQAYIHKILTGRDLKTLRKYKGISGFPKCCESDHDCFGVGHSSTSISVGVGFAKSRDLKKEKHEVVSIIGDGSLTGGMAFEALNHAGHMQANMTVILNDNEMSISKNVGAVSSYLTKLRTNPKYISRKENVKKKLESIPAIGHSVTKAAETMKTGFRNLVVDGQFFEELGFKYFGPVDGHDLKKLISVLERTKDIKGPKIIHVITKKGKGYGFAEENPNKFHGISPFNKETGEVLGKSKSISYTDAFSKTIVDLGKENKKIVAITAAMESGTGTEKFSKKYPTRFFDVGIAEQHAVTMAAAMAKEGMVPIVAIYSTFLQRAYDQIIHDVALQNFPVIFAIDRAGIVGEDGPTHHGVFDISYLRHIPNINIMAPKDQNELRDMIYSATKYNVPVAIRYPRGSGGNDKLKEDFSFLELGKGEKLVNGKDGLIIAIGSMVQVGLEVAEKLKESKIDTTVINARFVKPLDVDVIKKNIKDKKLIVTLEENVLKGGFGEEVESHFEDAKILKIGIEDKFVEHGTQKILRELEGLDSDNICERIKKNIKL